MCRQQRTALLRAGTQRKAWRRKSAWLTDEAAVGAIQEVEAEATREKNGEEREREREGKEGERERKKVSKVECKLKTQARQQSYKAGVKCSAPSTLEKGEGGGERRRRTISRASGVRKAKKKGVESAASRVQRAAGQGVCRRGQQRRPLAVRRGAVKAGEEVD